MWTRFAVSVVWLLGVVHGSKISALSAHPQGNGYIHTELTNAAVPHSKVRATTAGRVIRPQTGCVG
jgi:hypothetical protein